MIARLIIFSAILLFIDLLAFQAFRMLLGSSGRTVRIITYAIYWAIPAITVLFLIGVTMGWSDQLPKTIRVTLRAMIFIFYFAKLLIAVIILIDDLRRGLFALLNLSNKDWHLSTDRSKWMAYTAIILGSIPVVSLLYGMARNPYRYQVMKSNVKIKGLDPSLSGLKIVQISDIHSGSFLLKEPVERSIMLINELQPDLVVFTGDLVNSVASEMEPFVEMFGQIKAPMGVYSILGNHDYGDYHQWPNPEDKVKNFEDLKQIHRKMGWDLLLNEHRKIPYGNSRVNVIGVENYSANLRFHKYGDLQKANEGLEPVGLTVLLSHDPSHWQHQVLKEFKHIHLTLSGHTHGFQFGIEIPGVVKWSPIQYMYPQWAGLYEQDTQFLYVNRGLGYLGYPGRVGILPEITMLTIEAA